MKLTLDDDPLDRDQLRELFNFSREMRTRPNHYILDENHNPVPVDLFTWATAFEDMPNRIVKQTTCAASTSWVSTVFLGLDHSFSSNGPPVLFETMVFGGAMDGYQDRYCSWDQALLYHDLVVGQVESTPLWKHALANVNRDIQAWWSDLRIEVRSWYSKDRFLQSLAAIRSRRRWY